MNTGPLFSWQRRQDHAGELLRKGDGEAGGLRYRPPVTSRTVPVM